MTFFIDVIEVSEAKARAAMELLCAEDVGVTKPAEIKKLPLELIEQVTKLMPLAKRDVFRDAVDTAAAAPG